MCWRYGNLAFRTAPIPHGVDLGAKARSRESEENHRLLKHKARRKPITAFETAHQRIICDRAALSLTLETLFARYTTEGRHLPDGSLKTERYLEHLQQTGRYLAQFFGRGQVVSELTPDRVHDYVVWRRDGGAADRRVGANTIRRDLGMFKGSTGGGKSEMARSCSTRTETASRTRRSINTGRRPAKARGSRAVSSTTCGAQPRGRCGAGLSEGEIMKLCGWKTRAMFDRYNIIDEADLAAAVAKRFNGTVVAQSTLSTEPATR